MQSASVGSILLKPLEYFTKDHIPMHTIYDRICQKPLLTHTMAKNVFHHQSIAPSIS